MPELVVSGVVGDEQSLLVSGGGPSDDARATNSGLDDGNEGAELALENTVEVVRTAGCDQAVAVGELGEDADVVGVLVLYSVGH